MHMLSKIFRLVWRILTFPIWFPWLVIKKFGRQLMQAAKSLWKASIWIGRMLWKAVRLYLKYIYWIPAKFVFYDTPRWIYRTILAPIGRLLDRTNTLAAHGVYRVLSSFTKPDENAAFADQENEPPTPQLDAQSFAHCTICQGDTAHTVERISENTTDTLETCNRCGFRQAGQWHDQDIPLLESYA